MVETYLQQCGDSSVDAGDDEESSFRSDVLLLVGDLPNLSEIDRWRKKILSGTAKICLSVLLWTDLVFVLQHQSRGDSGTQVSTKFFQRSHRSTCDVGKSKIQTDILRLQSSCSDCGLFRSVHCGVCLQDVSIRKRNDCGF